MGVIYILHFEPPYQALCPPNTAVLETNDKVFCSPYFAANTPEVLLCCIEECTKIIHLGQDPYTDYQLINNAICLRLTTGLYLRPFEEWDPLLPAAQT